MTPKPNNFAFIDAQNVHLGVKSQGWILDMRKFRRYLQDKYSVTQAFIFIGYKTGNEQLYHFLQRAGFICIFKPTLILKDGTIKGNVDAELVLHSMIELSNYEKAVIVTGDGDFRCLVEYLMGQNKLEKVLIPNRQKHSVLLKTLCPPENNIFHFMNDLKSKIAKNDHTNDHTNEKSS
ncbi:TPA: hypothetical protein DEP96_01830 [Candidatus Uhrbacteria bacterium]|nr:hypothetical protein [Candidatus Uhrbacteria bacterium]